MICSREMEGENCVEIVPFARSLDHRLAPVLTFCLSFATILTVTFSEGLGAVCEDGVEDGQGVRETVCWPLRLSAFKTAKELSAE